MDGAQALAAVGVPAEQEAGTAQPSGAYRPGYELVAEQILQLIVESQLRPGDRMPTENELAARLGTSRTVVREAVKILSAIGRVRALDPATMRDLLGRDARADAVLSIRPWVVTGVQVEVADPADRTPYWVVATRRPTELATALRTLAPRADGDEPDKRSPGEDR